MVAALGESGTVLDLGGGTGLYRDLWPPGWRYICLDNDPEKLRGFFQQHARPGDGALLADVGAVPMEDSSVDVVFSSAVSHHLSDDLFAAFVGECSRVLRPGGTLIFLDAVWRPDRAIARLLWRYDRGSEPRTAKALTAAISMTFELIQIRSFATMHEYVLIVGSPGCGIARGEAVPTRREMLGAPESESRVIPIDDPSDASSTYDPAFFPRLFSIEDRHFWFRARSEVISAIVGQVVSPFARGYRVLDIGCGTGVVLKVLQETCKDGRVIGIDPFPEALAFARIRTTCDVMVGDAADPPISGTVEMIGMFDVLEHLEDDRGVLRNLRDRLVPGGALVLTVPAGPELWSYFDRASHHQRRYTRSSLLRVLQGAGFEVEFASYFMSPLYPLMRASRGVTERWKRDSGSDVDRSDEFAMRELRIIPGVNELLAWVLGKEARLIGKRVEIPCGTSLIAVARVPNAEGERRPRIAPASNFA